MKGRQLARFYELLGFDVVEACGVFWRRFKGPFYQSFPDQVLLDADPDSVSRMLAKSNGLGARYASTRLPGMPGGLYACRRRDYGLEGLAKRMRRYVKAALERCEIRPLDLDRLLRDGLRLNLDTMKRQGRYNPDFAEAPGWKRFVGAVGACAPEFSATGAFVDGELAAYMVTCTEDGWMHLLYENGRDDLRQHRPSYALDFSLIHAGMQDPAVEGVCGSPVAVGALGGLHDFKVSLGYDIEPHNVVLALHPAARPAIVNPLSRGLVGALRRLRPRDRRIERLDLALNAAAAARRPRVSSEACALGGNR